MKKVHFKNIIDLAQDVIEKLEDCIKRDETWDCVNVIGGFEDIKNLTTYLIQRGYDIVSIDLDDSLFGYKKEYVLSLDSSGIFVERAWREEKDVPTMDKNGCYESLHMPSGYINIEGTYTYIIMPTEFDVTKARPIDEDDPMFDVYLVELGEVEKEKCHTCETCKCEKKQSKTPVIVEFGSGDNKKTFSFTVSGKDNFSDGDKTNLIEDLRFLYDIFRDPWYSNF